MFRLVGNIRLAKGQFPGLIQTVEHLNLIASSSLPNLAERDLNNVANTARILVQDVSDVLRAIKHRGFDTPPAN